jgi:hypothetical protein
VVSHATNVVEHSEPVAERIGRFAGLVGRERVIASTDCGLAGRVHPQIAWAKLETLAQGAAIAAVSCGSSSPAKLGRCPRSACPERSRRGRRDLES